MRILISEEALQGGGGHWPSYIGDIASGLRALGETVDVAVHREATDSVIKRVGGMPWFTRNCWVDPKSQGGIGGIRHNVTFRKELTSWLKQHEPYDWVCAFTMRLQHLLAFALLSRSPFNPSKTRFFLLFVQGFGRYVAQGVPTEFPNTLSTKLARFCFRLMAPGVKSGRVVLAAETRGMQDELQRFTGLPVTLAPHPVEFKQSLAPAVDLPATLVHPVATSGVSSKRSSLDSRPLTIICQGFARHEKGTDLFQDAIRILLARPDADRFHFVLQWPEPFAMPDGSMLGPHPNLLSDHRVEFLNQNLNTDEYEALLARTDLVILPYRRNSYNHRVSRVAIEAAGRGIPIIYTTGTWSEEVAELSGCGVPISEESADEVADSILHAAEKLPTLKNRAEAGAARVMEYHSVPMLRRLLLG
jgi:glycosyltransferase involved in cell wall biosynthesis